MIIIIIIIDNHLDFSVHISNICETANQKFNALLWVSANMNSYKWTLLINYFIKSHFSCCSLIWMFCYQKRTKKVNEKQDPYLRLMTNNNELSYKELLDLTWAFSAPTVLKFPNDWGIQIPNGISPDIMNDTFAVSKHQYNSRHYTVVFAWLIGPADRYGRNSISYRGNQIWNLLPRQIKNSANLD